MLRFVTLCLIVSSAFGVTLTLDIAQRRIANPDTKAIVFVSMWAVGEPMQQAYEQIFSEFEEKHPQYRVEPRWEGRLALPSLRPRLLTKSDVPDILNTDLESLQVLIDENYAEPVDGILANTPHPDDHGYHLRDAIKPMFLDRCRSTPRDRTKREALRLSQSQTDRPNEPSDHSQEATYLIPAGVWLKLVFYNRLHYERLSLKEPQTWNAFLDNCRRLHAAGIAPFASDGYSYATSWAEIMLARMVGPQTLFQTIHHGEPAFDRDPRYKTVFQAIRELHQPGWYFPGWQGSRWPVAQRRWIQGEATHMINGSWLLRETLAYNPDPQVIKIGAFPVPLLDGQKRPQLSAYASLAGYSFIRGGHNRQGAIELVRFLLRRESANRLARLAREIPTVFGAAFPPGLDSLKKHLSEHKQLLAQRMQGHAPAWFKFVFHENYYPFFMHEKPSDEKYVSTDEFLRRLQSASYRHRKQTKALGTK